ncbi:hypothetical protein LVJ82_04385 [Vitreoscilla massiliensis]|uniref:Uncharacterized protein n=1 Tax=Vitreoscilla massiliensis TaxID=1689272 RepID=A0ABY4E384_9NEIS|nr:hypothetical protein [Vitreoscilla massiliensis]UOO90232.1 hypothetical protein LVJ82_04385 [Vitreoscilla massiliensis]
MSNTLAGYGISNAYNKTEVDNLLSVKVSQSNTLAGYGITDGVTKKELLTISATTASLPETIEKPISLVTIAAGDGMKDHSGFTYIRTTQYGGSIQYSQLAVPYSTASAPKLYGRHCYQGTETAWGRFDGADWNAAASETGYIYNKPTTLAGFGITDWVAKAYSGTGNIIADAIGNGVHSYGAGATDAATWLDGSSIGAQKMLQYGSAA